MSRTNRKGSKKRKMGSRWKGLDLNKEYIREEGGEKEKEKEKEKERGEKKKEKEKEKGEEIQVSKGPQPNTSCSGMSQSGS